MDRSLLEGIKFDNIFGVNRAILEILSNIQNNLLDILINNGYLSEQLFQDIEVELIEKFIELGFDREVATLMAKIILGNVKILLSAPEP